MYARRECLFFYVLILWNILVVNKDLNIMHCLKCRGKNKKNKQQRDFFDAGLHVDNMLTVVKANHWKNVQLS